MKRLLCVLLFAFPLFAADVEVGVDHVLTMMHGESAFDGGDLDVQTSRGFTAGAEVFFTPRVSTRFTATFINPVAILNPGDIDLNTLGIDTYAACARWHFTPAARFSPFAGGGVAFVSFGNLEQRFAYDIEKEVGNETTFFAEAGLRYRFRPRIFLPVRNCPPPTSPSAPACTYSKTVDVGNYGEAWQWIVRGPT